MDARTIDCGIHYASVALGAKEANAAVGFVSEKGNVAMDG